MYLECARWVPRLLVPEQNTVRVQICTELQQRLSDEGDSFLNKVITCDETWFYFFEPERKQQSSMWKHTWSPSPVKAHLSKSVGKVMSIIFCDTKGIVLNHMVPDITIVNGDYYSGVLRELLRRAIRDKCPELYRSGFILHQDNATLHVCRVVKQTMSDLNIEPLQHPPYSPDLAICDLFLFPTVKDNLRGRKFESREELGTVTAITEALRMVTRDGPQHVFRTWLERWDNALKRRGLTLKRN